MKDPRRLRKKRQLWPLLYTASTLADHSNLLSSTTQRLHKVPVLLLLSAAHTCHNSCIIRILLYVAGLWVVPEVWCVQGKKKRSQNSTLRSSNTALQCSRNTSPHHAILWSGSQIVFNPQGRGPHPYLEAYLSVWEAVWCWRHWRSKRTWFSHMNQAHPDKHMPDAACIES